MRQWNIDPSLLCRNHLLGEHNELHKALGSLKAGHSIEGYIQDGQLYPPSFPERHEELVQEMKNRGFNHDSEFPEEFTRKYQNWENNIDIEENKRDLKNRCPNCFGGDKK